MTTTTTTERPEQIVLQRGSVSLAELGLDAPKALDLAKKTPSIEPVFLVKFRSRQGKTRVEEIRAYAWPGQKIALAHMGYRADDARLLRLETRQSAEFPGRLFARFEKSPKQLEELRATAKLYERAMKQAASKPGRAERDVLPLVNAFKKLGSDVAIEMLIDTAAAFQRIDNATYASKMLGNLLKLVQKDKTVDVSLLARTVLAAADDGVFNAHLYEFTWSAVAKKAGVKTALGFGLRVFRRLLVGGRAIPADFVKVMRKAATTGKVADFEGVFDSTIVWAAGIASFWNTSRKTSDWRDEATADHTETQLLRTRLRELWMRAEGEAGAAWKREIWGRVQASMPELTSYGRMMLTESILAVTESSAVSREEAERILEAALAMLVKPPRSSDRARVERAGNQALFRVAAMVPDLLWERLGAIEDSLRTATGNVTSFVALYDLLSDVSEAAPPRSGMGLLRSVPGLEAAWVGALVAALEKTEKPRDDDDYDDDEEDEDAPPIVTLLGEALTLLGRDNAPEHLAELGKLVASRLAKDLKNRGAVRAWERVLATLHTLGPVGAGIAADATARFVKEHAKSEHIATAAPVAHLLDGDALRRASEARRFVDEVLETALTKAAPTPRVEKLAPPTKELGTDSPHLLEAVELADGTYRLLWADDDDVDDAKVWAITSVSADGLSQSVLGKEAAKSLRALRLWPTPNGLRVITVKDRAVAVLDEKLKPVGKFTLPEDFKGSWGLAIHVERFHVLFEHSEEVVVLDTSLKVVSEISGKGWGRWWILESPDGVAPPLIVHQGDPLNALYLEGKRIPPPKLGEMKSLSALARTDEGAFWIDYTTKKGETKRARWDGAAWKTGPATAPERPITDFGGLGGFGDQKRTIDPKHRGHGFASEDDSDVIVVKDALGVELAAFPRHGTACQCLNLATGVAIYQDAVVLDASLSARVDASRDLRAAIAEEGEPLQRALYMDRASLAGWVKNELESRDAGRAALATLGVYADGLLDAAILELMPRLAARDAVLKALDGAAVAPRPVPARVPGVSRTELRRLVRTQLKGNVGGFVFWAVDGADPSPVLEYLRADIPAAMPLAFRLLSLAQNPKTDKTLADRLLDLADAITSRASDKAQRFVLEPESYDWVEDDDDLASGRKLSIFVLDQNDDDALRNRPSRKYGKNEQPIEWSDEADERANAVKAWLVKGFARDLGAGAEVVQVGKNDGTGRIYRVPLTPSSIGPRALDVAIVWTKKDGFRWELSSMTGEATVREWEETLVALEQTCQRLGADLGSTALWPGKGLMRAEMYATLARAITFTRSCLAVSDQRDVLRPTMWSAPPVKGAEDPKARLWVMLAWVLGGVRYDSVGSTRKGFDGVAKACKLVTSGYYGMSPTYGSKKRTQYDDIDETDGHPELVAARAKTFLRLSSERSFDGLVILDDPAKIIESYTRLMADEAPAAPKVTTASKTTAKAGKGKAR